MKLVVAIALLAAAASAAPFEDTLTKAQVAAIVDAIQQALPPVDKAAVAKCQLEVDAYNVDPKAADALDHLGTAAACFRAAGSISAAIRMWTTVMKYGDAKQQHAAIRQLGPAYEAAAMFDRAASNEEQYARQYAADTDAHDQLQRALCIRRQLGDQESASRDGEAWRRATKRDPATACTSLHPIAMP